MYYVYLCRNVYFVLVCPGSMVGVKDTEMKIDNLEKALAVRKNYEYISGKGIFVAEINAVCATGKASTFFSWRPEASQRLCWHISSAFARRNGLLPSLYKLLHCLNVPCSFTIYIYILLVYPHKYIFFLFFVHMPTTTIFKD